MLAISPIIRLAAKIASCVIYAVTLLSAFGGWFNPHLFTFPAILTLAFPYLAILTFLLSVGWLAGRRYFIGGFGIAALLACWVPLTMAVPLRFSKNPEPGEKTFKLLTWNCLHLMNQKKFTHMNDYENLSQQDEALRYILHSGADIVCCQELLDVETQPEHYRGDTSLLDSMAAVYPYRVASNVVDQTVWSKYPVTKVNLHVEQNIHQQCYEFYRFNIDGHRLTIAGVHLISFTLSEEERTIITRMRNSQGMRSSLDEFKGTLKGKMGFAFSERASAAEEVCKAMSEIRGPAIVCGDFNDVPASWTYRVFLKNGFRDAYAETSFGPTYTYNAHMMLFHLDQIMYRGGLRPLSVRRGKIKTSDHYPLMAEFSFTDDDNR